MEEKNQAVTDGPQHCQSGTAALASSAASTRQQLGLLTEQELADALGVKTETLATWRGKSEGPAYTKLGKRIFYRREQVAEWIADSAVTPNKTERVAAGYDACFHPSLLTNVSQFSSHEQYCRGIG